MSATFWKTSGKGERRPTRSRVVLLILDMISQYDFEDGGAALKAAQQIVTNVAKLKVRAATAGVAVMYVNDTVGQWEADQSEFVKRCRQDDAKGRRVVRAISPVPRDYFIFKPKHSGFYATPLAELLQRLHAEELILTGLTSHQCVLFTAMDAYVRNFQLIVPTDCIGAPTRDQTRHALFILKESLMAKTPRSRSIRFN